MKTRLATATVAERTRAEDERREGDRVCAHYPLESGDGSGARTWLALGYASLREIAIWSDTEITMIKP
jgi:hypothetical protein